MLVAVKLVTALVLELNPRKLRPRHRSSRPTVLVDAELWEEMKHALNHLHDTNTFIEKEKEAAAQSIVRASYDLMMRDKAEQQMKAELETRRQMAAQMEQEAPTGGLSYALRDRSRKRRHTCRFTIENDKKIQGARPTLEAEDSCRGSRSISNTLQFQRSTFRTIADVVQDNDATKC